VTLKLRMFIQNMHRIAYKVEVMSGQH
jgi:hypothetical protein